MGIEPITSVLQTDASPSRPQTAPLLCPSRQHFVNKGICGVVVPIRCEGRLARRP
jgi:hypothetical protein